MPGSGAAIDLHPGGAASTHGPQKQQLAPTPEHTTAPVTHFHSGPACPVPNPGLSIEMTGLETSSLVLTHDHEEREREQQPIGPIGQLSYTQQQQQQQQQQQPPPPKLQLQQHQQKQQQQPAHHTHHAQGLPPAPDSLGQFGVLKPGPAIPVASVAGVCESLIGPSGYIPINGTSSPSWRPHGSLLSSKLVIDPPNLEEWRQKLFDADGLTILSNEQFEAYFPHVDNVYSHRSTQTYKKKPFISHYWDCRLKGRPPGTKKSDDPNKKRRNRVSRKLNLCDVKIKITEYFPGATLHDLDDGTYVPLDGAQALNGAHTLLVTPGQKQLRILPATVRNLPAPGQKFWTIQRVNGHISISGIPGPHKHTLARSDEVKKNSIQRYVAKQNYELLKSDEPKKVTGLAQWTIKKHEKESDMKLFAACNCPFSQRVWIALEAKGLPYQYCEEDLYKTAASQQLLEANPRRTVPAIRQGDWACAESAAILEYLEEMDDNIPLFPTDSRLRANCRQWIDHINSRIVPSFYRLLRNPEPAQQGNHIEKLQESIKELVLAADARGPFFLGSSLSLVDVHFVPFALRLSRILQPLRAWTAPAPGLRWAQWLDALENNAHVRATTSGKDIYTDTVNLLELALNPDGHLSP